MSLSSLQHLLRPYWFNFMGLSEVSADAGWITVVRFNNRYSVATV